MKPFSVTTVAVLSALAGLAQSQQQAAFEVVSVKFTDPSGTRSTFNFAPGELQVVGRTLRQIMEGAYDLRTFQVLGGPAWVDGDRYDISAKNDASWKDLGKEERSAEMRRALQAVLAERFQVKFHRETRDFPEFPLVVAKGGSKLKEADDGLGNGISMSCGVMKGTRTTMSNFAMVLSRQMARPVLDKTGLSGRYDFELSYEPDGGCGSHQSDGITSNSDILPERPSIFTAIQERLGLKLQAIKGPVQVIVIDHVEKPEPN